jgi:ABC-2 type transport system ATP-binding protein
LKSGGGKYLEFSGQTEAGKPPLFLEQDEGNFTWFGQKSHPSLRKRIGSLIETPTFYPYLNLVNNLKILAQIKECGTDDIPEVLKLVKLYDRRKSRFSTLSLGMKQRLGIAATLMGNPEVLVLDEPTNGLDPEGIAEVRDLITLQAANGKTIIMASHILNEVEKVCTEVAILKGGQLLAQGNVRSLLKGESVLEVKCADPLKLLKLLEKCPFVNHVKAESPGVKVNLKEGSSSADLNRYVFDQGLVLSEIILHQKSLESQFLELVKE